MISLRPSTKTLICIGSGGVGKTTIAAALGVGFANSGKKVLVLTIDPSMRLAQTLGIKSDGEPHRVQLNEGSPNENFNGELWAATINHQETFAWFMRNVSGRADIESLLQNSLYQQLSGRLSGSQEFTSLVSLYRQVTTKKYDLVILDTPPSQHTWNFLQAPEKIAALFNEGIASWFRQTTSEKNGVLKKIMSFGTTQVLKALETLTGSYFMSELAAFFSAIQKWQAPLENYIMDCHRLLASTETEFILVTTLDSSRIAEAGKLCREIQKQGYQLTSIIINRVPAWTKRLVGIKSARIVELIEYYESLENDLQSQLDQFNNSLKVYKCFELRQSVEDDQTNSSAESGANSIENSTNLQKIFTHIVSVN